MKTSTLSLLLAALLPAVFAAPLPEKAELLAANTVVAQYLGMKERICCFRTALCPDRCDHAMKAAQFRVLTNESYDKKSKYGDDKAEPGNLLLVDARNDVPGQPDDMRRKLSELKPGQVVRITQKHYYGDMGGVHMPVRPVTQLEVLKGGACEDIPSIPSDPANHDHEAMPLNPMRR